jgi:hypothetical protein
LKVAYALFDVKALFGLVTAITEVEPFGAFQGNATVVAVTVGVRLDVSVNMGDGVSVGVKVAIIVDAPVGVLTKVFVAVGVDTASETSPPFGTTL